MSAICYKTSALVDNSRGFDTSAPSTAETVLRALEGTHERRRGRNLQQIFATAQLSDAAVDAANRAGHRWESEYNSFFPAWALYRRVVAGVGLYDGQLEGFAVWLAEIHANKINSRPAKSKPRWVHQAGLDSLDYAIHGRFAESLKGRAERFGVHWSTYRSIRNPVASYLWRELEAFGYLLHAEYIRVLRDQQVRGLGNQCFTVTGTGINSNLSVGCSWTPPAPNPDNL